MSKWPFRAFVAGACVALAGVIPMLVAAYGAIAASLFFDARPFDSPWFTWPFWIGASLVLLGWSIAAGATGAGLQPKAPPPPPMPDYIKPMRGTE